jgi:multiple sugar transport system ATP-binding protein
VVALISDRPVPLPDGYAALVGQDCILGLRPESLHFVTEGTPGAIPVEVEAETPLNEKTVTLVLTLRGREIMVSRPAGTPGPASGKAHVAAQGASALLFDRATGARIAPAAAIRESAA